jgi:hypothetical protein
MPKSFWLFSVALSLMAQQYNLQCRCDTSTLQCSCQLSPVVAPPAPPPPAPDASLTTDTSPKPVVPLSRPTPGQVIVEPTFGTKIVRVTDDTSSWTHLHTDNALSLNNRWLMFYNLNGMGGRLASFDPVTLRVLGVWKELGTAPNSTRVFRPFPKVWSTTDGDKAWTVSGLEIGYWNFANGTFTVAANLKGQLPPDVAYLVFRSMSADERRFVLQTQDSAFVYTGMAVYDMVQQKVVYFQRAPGIKPNGDQSGKWAVSVVPEQIIEVDTGNIRPFPYNFVWHASYGHEAIYGPDSARHDFRKFDLRTLVSSLILPQTPSTDWSQGTHTSITLDEKWLCSSRFTQTKTPGAVEWLRDEIDLILTDGSGRLKRLAHHRSNWVLTGNYWHMPRAAVSYDGKFVVFTSNWGDPARSDVYVIAVP